MVLASELLQQLLASELLAQPLLVIARHLRSPGGSVPPGVLKLPVAAGVSETVPILAHARIYSPNPVDSTTEPCPVPDLTLFML